MPRREEEHHRRRQEEQQQQQQQQQRGMNVANGSSSRGRSCHRRPRSPEEEVSSSSRRRSLTPCGRPPGLDPPLAAAAANNSDDLSLLLLSDNNNNNNNNNNNFSLREEEEEEEREADRRELGGAELPGVTAVTSTARPGPSGQCRQPRGQQQQRRSAAAGVRSTIPARGPPPAPPRKLDYKRPAMTRAMLAKLRHTQKLQEELERRERERRERDRIMPPPSLQQQQQQQQRRQIPAAPTSRRCDGPSAGAAATRKCPPPAANKQQRPTTAKLDATQCPPPLPTACGPQPSRSRPCPGPGGGGGISARTRNLAKTMNADIVQAEPLDKGAIDNIIIPAGAINADKTTIVSLPPPSAPETTTVLPSSTRVDHATTSSAAAAGGCCPVANKSAQVIAESLDEQEAAEAAVVNSKLQHLQQARRDFVMSVADVGGTAISLDAADLHVSDISAPAQLLSDIASPPRLYRCPSLDDPYLKPECGRDHPQVAAARDYLQDKRFEDMFARYGCRDDDDGDDGDDGDAANDFLDQEFLDTLEPGDLIDLDDDDFDVDAAAAADDVDYCDRHRNAKQRTAIPRRRCEPYRYEPDNLERLQKFCDPANYPHYRPSPPHRRSSHHRDHNNHRHHRHHRRRGDGSCSGRAQPPPGRENLPEDLWDLQDPWANNNDCPDQQRDLMDFSKDDDC